MNFETHMAEFFFIQMFFQTTFQIECQNRRLSNFFVNPTRLLKLLKPFGKTCFHHQPAPDSIKLFRFFNLYQNLIYGVLSK